jgi:hypothetical protein
MEDLLAMFSDTGINVIETAEAEADEGEREEAHEEPGSEGGELVEMAQKVPAKSEAKEPAKRTDDPVDMYCRRCDRSSCFQARARSLSPSASRPAARR